MFLFFFSFFCDDIAYTHPPSMSVTLVEIEEGDGGWAMDFHDLVMVVELLLSSLRADGC